MARAPNPGPSATVVARGIAAIGIWRLSAVAMPHLAALVIMFRTENDFGSGHRFFPSWGIIQLLFIALLRRPPFSRAPLLGPVVVLVVPSRPQADRVLLH